MGFQKGQTIRAIRAAESAYGHKFAPGDEVVVTSPDMPGRPGSHPHHRLGVNTAKGAAEGVGETSEWIVNSSDFEPVTPDVMKFKKGDKVTVREGATSANGWQPAPVEARTVMNPDWGRENLVYLNTVSGYPGNLYRPEDLDLVTTEPKWSDVGVGDKVRIRLKATREEFEGTGYVEAGAANVRVLGLSTSGLAQDKFELLSVEKPKPSLPTTNGSRVIESEPEGPGLEPMEAVLVAGRWLDANRVQTWVLKPDMWTTGWTLLHDAGKDAS